MALNFNVSPYYDDFDPNKNFHRILFKPGYAVQARELTQSQTILQNQISKFADHVFQKNTPVSGAKLTYNPNAYYVKLLPTYGGSSIDVVQFENILIQNQAGDVIAKVVAVNEATGTEVEGGDPDTLIVTYLSGNHFNDSDVIYSVFNPNLAVQATASNSTGKSSVVSINEGVFYVVNGFSISEVTGTKYSIGHFVNVLPQTIVVGKYTQTPSARIGLNINETIIDYVDDVSLLDPADGAPNYQGPGADRFKISLDLETRSLSLGDDQGFIELMRLENGQIKKQVDGTVYATIDEYFAKRTFDTNGDYIVTDFKLTPSANTNSSDKYNLSIGKGVAYVRGYRLENQSDFDITSDRARETSTKLNDSTFINYGNFVYTTTANGFFDFASFPSVDLHVIGSGSIVTTNANTYNATVAATAKLRGLEIQQQSGGKTTYIYRTYLTDIENKSITDSLSGSSNTTSVYFNNTGGKLSATNDAYNGVKIAVTTGGITEFRKVVKYYGATRYADLDTALTITPTGSSISTLHFDVKDSESVTYMNTGSTPYKFKANAEISVLSKENNLATGNTIINESLNTPLIYPIGYPYVSDVSNSSYTTNRIFRNLSFGSTSATITIPSGEPFQFLSTSPSDWLIINNATGALGSVANVSNIVLSGDQKIATLTIVGSSDLSSIAATVTTKVGVTNADNNQYILKYKNLVTGDTSDVHISGTTVNTYSKVDLTYGQVYVQYAGIVTPGQSQSLYVSDVKKIVKIIDTQDSGTAATADMIASSSYDVTSNYYFDNGQRDNYYGHASIKLKPGRPKAKGNLLVIFDYYDYDNASGDGYFSVNSYLDSLSPENYSEIPSYKSKNGSVYSLRDSLDFRPTVLNAQANYTFDTHSGSIYVPVNKDNFVSDYSYYLARKDLLVLSKDKNFEIVKGTSGVNPLYPVQPDGSLIVAKLALDPYTAYVPGEGPKTELPNLSIEKIKHKRWTMQDISDMETRVNNIEYYTALNALEKNAQSLQIPDVNGLNRFKNGILVDDFSSFATADTENPDYYANINRREKTMTAPQIVDGLALQNQYILNSAHALDDSSLSFKTKKIGSTTYFMLPYTTANLASQTLASNTVNLNPFAVSQFEGVLDMNPPMDNWVDNTKQPDLLIVDPDLQLYQSSNTLNTLSVGDWKVIPGTQYSTSTSVTSGATITTTTQTFASLNQAVTLGYYDKLGSSYYMENGFITDISVLPYIRSQQILVKASGLLINTPIKTWFDGVNVDKYMTTPDTIELRDVYGTFEEDDVIGYTYDSAFWPIATVASVYTYPSSNTSVRLYVYGNKDTFFHDVTKIESAKFNASGTYTGNTAFGTPATTGTVIDVHRSGFTTSVGDNITDKVGNPWKFFKTGNKRYGSFAEAYGIWSASNGGGQYLTPTNGITAANFSFTVPKSNTYYIKLGAEWGESEVSFYQVKDSSNNVISFTNDGTYTKTAAITLPEGTSNVSFRLTATSATEKDNYFALAISDKPWVAGNKGLAQPGANVIFSTASLPSLGSIDGVNTKSLLRGGGAYFTGVTRLSLMGLANTTNGFYDGTKISVSSTSVYFDTAKNAYVVEPHTSTATVTSYVGANTTVFLDTPVKVSIGRNDFAGEITSNYTLTGTSANSHLLAINNHTIPKLSTDESGSFTAIFNLPDNTFKTGERILKIDNRIIDTDPTSATTYAQGTFTASGLATKSQAINFSPSISAARNTFTRTNYQSNKLMNTTVTSVTIRRDPVCQTFIVESSEYPNGVFLNSIKLFFAQKPTDLSVPVTLSIVGTTNGYPDGSTLDNSIVTMKAQKVKTSTNPHYLDKNTYTEFVFPAPVYIQPDVMYAVLLQTPSDQYIAYIAAQNAIAIPSTVKNLPTDVTPTNITKIGTAPYVGSLFVSQNDITWTADQGKALMFTMERCVFNTSVQPQLPFVVPTGLPQRKLTGQQIGVFYDANNVSNLYGVTSLYDKKSHAYNITTTDFKPSDTSINYSYRSVLDSDKSFTSDASVTPGKYGCPTSSDIYLNDGKGERLLISSSNDSFKMTATLSSSDNTVSPIISDDGTTLYNIQWQINNMELSNNIITIVDGGTGYNVNAVSVTVSAPDDVNGSQAVARANVSGGIIQNIYFTDGGSGYYSTPSITVEDSATRSGNTDVSFVVHGETSASGGNGIAKYITKKVALAPGNESGDLRVYYTAYRPLGTNINVYYKVLNGNDTQLFDDANWVLMTNVGNNSKYSRTRTDLIEFESAPGTNNTSDDFISYTSTNGQTYTSFNQFAIKIVLSTNDKTSVPFLSDIRTVALPSGTGI